ncbi:MAG: hypothetical protein GC134_03830 [Proteobacteria bacterium]|nr:hypothetical protein [Pseudomonadota bacterium]
MRQIDPSHPDYARVQALLTELYGPSPDKTYGWHIYPVRQASTGAHVVCVYNDGGTWMVGLIERGGTVEHAGSLSATFGGFVDVPRHEQPDIAVCREAREESNGLLVLSPERLVLIRAHINYGEVKHWHADHATTTVSYMTELTADEYAVLSKGVVGSEVAGLTFVPLADVQRYQNRFAYKHEFRALLEVRDRLV